jgi:3',5'-cyclic AMP phosphodiesterase CpdA
MTTSKVLVVSDTHLSPRTPDAEANWSAIVDHVAETRPDLVLHLGDLALDGPHNEGDLPYARGQLDRLAVPWLAVPGNHDIGDNPTPVTPAASVVDAAGLGRWNDLIGKDRWSAEVGGWRIVAVNAQLFGSGLPAESDQWAWLQAEVEEHAGGPPVAFVTHKPLTAADDGELAAAPPYRFVPIEAQRRLAGLLDQVKLGLVLSGHVHQYRVLRPDGTPHVWAPTTWAVLSDESQTRYGDKRCGAVALELSPPGPEHQPGPQFELIEPEGIRQLTMGQNTPNPYSH